MDTLKTLSSITLGKITDHRSGEIKFGERLQTVPEGIDPIEFIQSCSAKFILFGIPEDIGVRANYGRPGAFEAWESALKTIANIQHNKYCKANQVLVLGHLDFSSLMNEASFLNFKDFEDRKKLSSLVESIDKEVSHLIFCIVKAGKIPIVIGGGHNNAYGNIKGTALAYGKAINAINLDAHSDFRILEGRHSGNGFSYAYDDGFLKKYFIFGLHESYTSKNVLDNLKKLQEKVRFNTYDEIAVRKQKKLEEEMFLALEFIKAEPFGLEIDLDSLPNVPSSAMTFSGFSVETARQFVYFFGSHTNVAYLHLCEGAPSLGDEKNKHLVGKLMGYLITDFIKAQTQTAPQI